MKKQIITAVLVLSLCTPLIQNIDSSAAKVCLNQKKITLTKGSTRTLKVKGISKKKTVKWKSSNKKIATVNKKGVVTAKKKGSATITATVKKQKLRCKVNVVAKKVTTAGKQETATTSKAPVSSKSPAASPTVMPTMTQKPATSKYPDLQYPSPTKAPAFPWLPTFSQTPGATKTPAATKSPSATKIPAPTKAPSATNAPTGGSSSNVTEESAYQTLNSLRSTYPEGMPLTNSYYYYSPCFGNGYGCYGFAAKLSDTVFGTGKSCSTHTSFDKIKVGDNIRIGNSHSVIVLTKSNDAITVVEGNYNSSVHWDRRITKSSLEKDGYKVTTRY